MTRYLVASDAGGTMTDVIIVDEEGRFVIGKAPTTPHDESIGYMESFDEALTYWDLGGDGRTIAENTETAIYTGTAMLNTLINMNGLKTGLIVTRGFEDMIIQGRGSQSFIGADWSEIVHMQYRKHRTPLVPRKLTRGVTERIDLFGQPVIPMYEHDAKKAAEELIAQDVQSIAVVFLNSFANPAHEQRCAEIAREVIAAADKDIPVVLSCEVAPIMREVSRANATIIQAYAAEPARAQLETVEKRLSDIGYDHSLKTVLCYGGVTNIRYPRLFETVMSGPVGGMMGGYYLANNVGIENLVCSDMGGTSFDAGCITQGILPINREPPFQQMYVNVPMLDIQSIGAGTGTYIRVDQYTNRLKLGPDSAGGTPGPVFQDAGNETPTIGDCDLILGIINPDYYLGGRVKVYKDKAEAIFQEKVSGPLGLGMHTAAEQCVDLVNIMMREHLIRTLMLGFDINDYVLAGYGGAGPMHLCGFAGEDTWKGVITVPYAAAFSAWGCACMDYAHRRHRSVSAMIAYGADDDSKLYTAGAITSAWQALENQLLEELTGEGFNRDQIKLKQLIYMRYYGQLDDLEVESPVTRLTSAEDVDKVTTAFEDLFTRTYTLAGKPPYATFLINEVAITAQVETVKPAIVKNDSQGPEPPKAAFKEKRKVFQRGQWHDADIYEMDELRPGNEISGLAVIEAPSTTLFLPLDWHARLDENLIFRLERSPA